jgi:LacI family transcriptional regulator
MPTLKDIAKACGVSYPTVSHVLNGTRPVSDATRRKVLEAIEEFKYHPNALARGLLKKKVDTLSVLCPHSRGAFVLNHHLGPVMDGIVAVAMSQGQSVMLSMASEFRESPRRLRYHCDGRSDGLLVVGQPTQGSFVQALRKADFPFVCIDEAHEDADVPCVDADHAEAAHILTKYLLEQGHRRIVALPGDDSQVSTQLRLQGYHQALAEHGVQIEDRLILPGDYSNQSGYERTLRLLDSTRTNAWPTALACMSDNIALGALQALAERGVSVPEQISVAGIDDVPAACTSSPPLTTIRLPFREMGEQATQMLLAQIRGEDVPRRRHLVQSHLVERRSVAPPR